MEHFLTREFILSVALCEGESLMHMLWLVSNATI